MRVLMSSDLTVDDVVRLASAGADHVVVATGSQPARTGFQRALPLRDSLPGAVRIALCTLATFGLWILAHRLADGVAGGFFLTITWSLVAFAAMAAGFVLKERTYRLLALGILGAAIARIALLDVWQLETLHRILSFLVLGAVLLTLAFLYNRYADTLRRWL